LAQGSNSNVRRCKTHAGCNEDFCGRAGIAPDELDLEEQESVIRV